MTEREGHTPLFAAVSRGWGRAVEHLIAKGAEVDVVDARGRTLIDVAMGLIGGRETTVSEDIAATLERHLATTQPQ